VFQPHRLGGEVDFFLFHPAAEYWRAPLSLRFPPSPLVLTQIPSSAISSCAGPPASFPRPSPTTPPRSGGRPTTTATGVPPPSPPTEERELRGGQPCRTSPRPCRAPPPPPDLVHTSRNRLPPPPTASGTRAPPTSCAAWSLPASSYAMRAQFPKSVAEGNGEGDVVGGE
jgi:hypothetical protein